MHKSKILAAIRSEFGPEILNEWLIVFLDHQHAKFLNEIWKSFLILVFPFHSSKADVSSHPHYAYQLSVYGITFTSVPRSKSCSLHVCMPSQRWAGSLLPMSGMAFINLLILILTSASFFMY